MRAEYNLHAGKARASLYFNDLPLPSIRPLTSASGRPGAEAPADRGTIITVALEGKEDEEIAGVLALRSPPSGKIEPAKGTHAMEAPRRRLAMMTMAASFIRIVLSVSTFCHFNVMAVERKA